MTTNPTLARARALLDGITPGEWTTEQPFTLMDSGMVMAPDGVCIARKVSKRDAAFIASAPTLVRELCDACEAQAARVAALERVLRLFADDKPGAIYRRFDDTYARQYCALCGSEWAVGESERHSAYCPVPAARALLEADHDDR